MAQRGSFTRYKESNLSDLEFDFACFEGEPMSSIGLPIYDFLLISTSNHMSLTVFLTALIGTWTFPPYLLSLGHNFVHPQPPAPPGVISQNLIIHFRDRGKAPTENEIDWCISFWDILFTHALTSN